MGTRTEGKLSPWVEGADEMIWPVDPGDCKELRESEELYRTTFNQAAVGIVLTSSDGRIIRSNNRFAEIVGYTQEELLELTDQQITRPEDLAASELIGREFANGAAGVVSWEKCYVRKDGAQTWTALNTSAQRDKDGSLLYTIAIVEEINDRKAAEKRSAAAQKAQKASEARYRIAFQTSPESVNISRASDGAIIDINNTFLETTGYKRSEVIGRTTLDLGIWANDRDRRVLIDVLQQHSTCRDLEFQFQRKNGEVFWARLSASLIEIGGCRCLLSFARDISETKLAEEEIKNLAFYDPLTHLPNRRLLTERLRQALPASARSNRIGALLFIDLDNFKMLNDTLGHHTGDLLLQEVSRRLSTCVREADTVARVGGDEFVVILESLSDSAEGAAAQAKIIAEKILNVARQSYLIAGHECLSACSIGITMFGCQQETADDVLQQADIAMYQSKAAGRDTVRFFAPALQAAVNERAAMVDDLREAIRANQFLLYYQPQVLDGKLIGAEALVRWKHPRRGLVPPNDFIPLAEETGLILSLGNWVLETACLQIAAWSALPETSHLTVAVNISAREFRQTDFVEQVLEVVERTGADPTKLKLELTESMLVDNMEDVIDKMARLKAEGLRFSLDDFGTGYSSLSYLKRLPLDQLKIDRAFVRDMLVDTASGAIAQTIVSLCRAMGLSVIAEGVESEEQREFLAGHGCQSYQGYLYSRPLPLNQFELLPGFAEQPVPASC